MGASVLLHADAHRATQHASTLLACLCSLLVACDHQRESEPQRTESTGAETAPATGTTATPARAALDPFGDPGHSIHSGPRCSANDPNCLPFAHHNPSIFIIDPNYKPNLPRNTTTIAPIWSSGPTDEQCDHDGDCEAGSCGNDCQHWTSPESQFGTCAGDPSLSEAFCGCVAKHCQWFTQPRQRLTIDLWNVIDVKPDPIPKDGPHGWEGYDLEKDVGWRRVRAKLVGCYKQQIRALPQRLRLTFRVDQRGQVKSARAVGGATAIRKCTQQVLSSTRWLSDTAMRKPRQTGATIKATMNIRVEHAE